MRQTDEDEIKQEMPTGRVTLQVQSGDQTFLGCKSIHEVLLTCFFAVPI